MDNDFVDMRKVYDYLGIKTKFRDWSKRRLGGMVSGVDFVVARLPSTGGRPAITYKITKKLEGEILKSETLDYRMRVFAEKEHGALCAIEQILGVKLERQYSVGNYRLDGYHKETNTAYEIDECYHFKDGGLRSKCEERQRYIERELGCKFIRITV